MEDFEGVLAESTVVPQVSEEGQSNDVEVTEKGVSFAPAESTGIKVEKEATDVDGLPFDPAIHQADENGKPICFKAGQKAGFIKKKRGKKGQATLGRATDENLSKLIAGSFLKLNSFLIGDFECSKKEYDELTTVTEEYLATTETTFEPPPWVALVMAYGFFSLKKVQENSEKESKKGFLHGFFSKRAEKKAKKEKEKAEKKSEKGEEKNGEVKDAA